uniref:Uncharacterized protein n=1 Tax=Arundo donax TaxID=35708 RepID=A0A0A9CJ27_ARUDO
MFASASAARDTTPSRRPSCTSQRSRPNWNETASLAASATMSAQETVTGHTASSTAFAVSITSNPPSDLFGAASFSAAFPAVDSISTDASQPLTKQSWKKRRRSLAGSAAGSAATRASTMSRTTASAAGQPCR